MVKFKMVFNSDVTKQMNKHAIKKNWWVFLIISVSFVIIGLFICIEPDSISDMFLGIIMTAIGALFTPLCILLTNYTQKKLNNTMSIMGDETTETFIFDADRVVIIDDKGDDYHAETVARYTYFYRVEESPTHYFLYISQAQAHILAKSSLVEGTLDELNEIFSKNMGKNFKVRKK